MEILNNMGEDLEMGIMKVSSDAPEISFPYDTIPDACVGDHWSFPVLPVNPDGIMGTNIQWSVSDPSVVDMTPNGNRVTLDFIGVGVVVIRADDLDNNKYYEHTVTVQPAPVPPVTIQEGAQITHTPGLKVYEFTPTKTATYAVYFEHNQYGPSVAMNDSTGAYCNPRNEFGHWKGGKNYVTGYRWDLTQGETYTLQVDCDDLVGTMYLKEAGIATGMSLAYTMEGYAPYGLEAIIAFEPVYAEAPDEVTYTIANTDIASIDGAYVEFLTPGTTTLTATSGSLTTTVPITVLAPVSLPLDQAVSADMSAAGNLRYSFTVAEAGNYAIDIDADVIQVPEEGIDAWVEDADGGHVRQWFTASNNPYVIALEPGTYELVCRSYECEVTAKICATDAPVTDDGSDDEDDTPQFDENDYSDAVCNGDIFVSEEKQVQLTWDNTKQYYTFTPDEDGNYIIYTNNIGDFILNAFESATDESDPVMLEKKNWETFETGVGWFGVYQWQMKAGTTYDLVFMGDGYTVDFALDEAKELNSIRFWNAEVEEYEYSTVTATILSDPVLAYPGEVSISVSDPDVICYEEENEQFRLLKPGTATVTATNGTQRAKMDVTVLEMPEITLGQNIDFTNDYGSAFHKFTPSEDGEYVFKMNCAEPISILLHDALEQTDLWEFWKAEGGEELVCSANLCAGTTYTLSYRIDESETYADVEFTMEITLDGESEEPGGSIIPDGVTPTAMELDKRYAQAVEEKVYYTYTVPADGYYAVKTDAEDFVVEVESNMTNIQGWTMDVLDKDYAFAMELSKGDVVEFGVIGWVDSNIWLESVSPVTKLEVVKQDTSVVYPNGVYIMPFHTLKDVTLKVTFADGTTALVEGSEIMETSAISTFPIDIAIEDETGKITLSCCGANVEYTIKLDKKKAVKLEATLALPFDFYENEYGWMDNDAGRFIYEAETLAVWEADYKLTFSDGSTEMFNLPADGQAQYRGVNLDIMNPQWYGNYWSVGTNTIELNYGGLSASLDVEIKANPVDSIELLDVSKKEYVLGDPEYFELTDDGWCMIAADMAEFELKVNYKDGTSKILTEADLSVYNGIAADFDLLGGAFLMFDFDNSPYTGAGKGLVAIGYMGYTAFYEVDFVEETSVGNSTIIPEDVVDAAIEAVENGTVKLEATATKEEAAAGVVKEEVKLPTNKLAEMAENPAVQQLEVKLDTATITLDAAALKAVAGQAEGSSVILSVQQVEMETLTSEQQETLENETVAMVLSALILSDGKVISDFEGGLVTIAVDFEVPAGKSGEAFVVCYISDTGEMEFKTTTYENGKLIFITDHFSDYVVLDRSNSGGSNPGIPAPNTGDNANLLVLVVLLLMSGAMAVALLVLRKKFRA